MRSSADSKAESLRRRAELLLDKKGKTTESLELKTVKELALELAVHQAELEMQNEELREIQAAMQETQDRFAALYEHAPVGYVVLDAAGIIRQTNATWRAMLNREEEEFRGRPFIESMHDGDASIFLARFRAFYRNPLEKHIVVRMKRNGSVPFYARIEARPRLLTPSKDEFTSKDRNELMVVVSDISESRKAEDMVRGREQYLRTILQTTKDGFWVIGAEGRLIEVNEAYCAMSGYSREELLGMGIADLDVEEEPDETAARIGRIIQNGSELFETRHRRKDGRAWNVEVSVTYLDQGGGQFVCFCRDLSERKRTEEQLLRLQKAESLGRMAGAVAHNYNNILSIVIGNLDLAMHGMSAGTDLKPLLLEAMNASARAVEMGALMLSYLGLTVVRRERMDLAEICRQNLAGLRLLLAEKVNLQVELPLPGPVVCSNAEQIGQVLKILVLNAGEAMEETGGAVSVVVRTDRLRGNTYDHIFPADSSIDDAARYALVEVRDRGCGILSSDMVKLCDPFFTTKFTGRGMGLPVVLGMVKAHDGCLTVRSELGKGSVFCVWLPIVD